MAVLIAGGGTAAVVDLASRRIPNAISAALAAAGVMLALAGASGITLQSSMLGVAAGLALMLPGHLLGATGAGDVKLFAASGAVLGIGQILEAFAAVTITGGVFALGVAWRRGRLVRTVTRTARLWGPRKQLSTYDRLPMEDNAFPYGPAIAVGCVLAALV